MSGDSLLILFAILGICAIAAVYTYGKQVLDEEERRLRERQRRDDACNGVAQDAGGEGQG